MQTKSVKDEYLRMIKHGLLDIIVGTHALLGDRVVYSNLGLLVVDEEQVSFLASMLSSAKNTILLPAFACTSSCIMVQCTSSIILMI